MTKRLHLWIPTESSIVIYETLIKQFCVRHPDVSFQLTDVPLACYWQKVIEHQHKEDGPDIFFMHNEQAKSLLKKKLLSPYVFTSFQRRILSSCYPKECDHVYYYDFAYLTSLLYVNENLEILLDVSWSQLINLLNQQKGFPYDFGCSVNLDGVSAFHMMALLQHSQYGKQQELKAKEWLESFFRTLKIYPPQQDCKQAFIAGEIAMVYSWGWFAGYLNDKEISYQIFHLPHEEDASVYDRRNTKSSFGISMNCQYKEIANTFIFEFLSDLAIQKYFCLKRKVVPIHRKLQNDEDILADRIILAQKAIISHTIFPLEPVNSKDIHHGIQRILNIYEAK